MSQSPNVDPNEIHKFDAMAQDWWNPNGSMKPLHQLNPLRMTYIETHCDLAQKRVCDVGCGGGLLAEALARADAEVTAIDLSPAALDVAKQHAKESQLTIDYQLISIEQLAEKQAQTFDVVTCLEMLEHVPDPVSVIQHCVSLLKPGGVVFFSTINRDWRAFLGAILAAEYVLRLLPIGTHEYAKFIKPSELNEWAEQAGLTLRHLQGIQYNPLSGHYRLSQDVSINYLSCYRYEKPNQKV